MKHVKVFLLLSMIYQTVAQLRGGVFKEVRRNLEYMSWSICDRFLNPRRETDTVKLVENCRDHESEMFHIKNQVERNMQHEVQLCLAMHNNKSYTVCDFLDFDIAKIRYHFCWNPADFVQVQAFLTGINNMWYRILTHLDRMRLINMTRTTTEYWPDIHGTTKPVNLNFHINSQFEKSYYQPISHEEDDDVYK